MKKIWGSVSLLILFLFCIGPVHAGNWDVTVKALFDQEPVTFGFSEKATDAFDYSVDEYATKADDLKIVMTLDRIYRKSIKKDTLKWSFTVNVPSGKFSYLIWNVSGAPEKVILVKDGESTYVNMMTSLIVDLKPGWHEYTIYADSEAAEYLAESSGGTREDLPSLTDNATSGEKPALTTRTFNNNQNGGRNGNISGSYQSSDQGTVVSGKIDEDTRENPAEEQTGALTSGQQGQDQTRTQKAPIVFAPFCAAVLVADYLLRRRQG